MVDFRTDSRCKALPCPHVRGSLTIQQEEPPATRAPQPRRTSGPQNRNNQTIPVSHACLPPLMKYLKKLPPKPRFLVGIHFTEIVLMGNKNRFT